jgi:hypothetical protein
MTWAGAFEAVREVQVGGLPGNAARGGDFRQRDVGIASFGDQG